MSKIIIGLAVIVGLIGCVGEVPSSSNAKNSKVCLDGVNYYMFKATQGNAGYGYLAPVFNKDTKQVELCNE